MSPENSHRTSRHWMHQRMTAIANVPLTLWALCSLSHGAAADYGAFTAWLSSPPNASLLILTVVSVFFHAPMGIEVVLEDYVQDEKLRKTALALVRFYFVAAAVLCIYAILTISGHGL
jgi:succinate dehydrogenase / fumarate reductase membrane anchor subunit